ncbi:MAG: hypothetical protein NXI32_27645 [bacterium]|nr:hypothetical protein [bacterium]
MNPDAKSTSGLLNRALYILHRFNIGVQSEAVFCWNSRPYRVTPDAIRVTRELE